MSLQVSYDKGLLYEVSMHDVARLHATHIDHCCPAFTTLYFGDKKDASDGHRIQVYLKDPQAIELRDQLIEQFPLPPAASSEPVPVLLRLTPAERASLKEAIEKIDDEELEARMEGAVGDAVHED